MMFERKRTEDQLTTADLAGTTAGNISARPGQDLRSDRADVQTRNAIPREDTTAEFSERPGPELLDPQRPRLVRGQAADTRDWRANPPTLTDPYTADSSPSVSDQSITDQPAQSFSAAMPLFSDTEIGNLRSRWSNVQAGFVDEPRRAVEEADQLVATVMQRLAEGFASERSSLERQWDSGDNVSTEDLRLALQRYRTFFGRLLNAA